MPMIGETRKARELGYKGSGRYIWASCEICGKERWVLLCKGYPIYERCLVCAEIERGKRETGENSPSWKGGKTRDSDGYILIWLSPEDFFYPMTSKNDYILEHRLVMAKHLGRCLHSWEIVHHKNGVKDDNQIENLELSVRGAHAIIHNRGYQDGYRRGLIDGRLKQFQGLKEQNEELLKQIKLIQFQNKELIGLMKQNGSADDFNIREIASGNS